MDKLVDLIKNHPEQINALAAVCALFVSFLSILLTVYTSWLQRRHNFKSLTPIASIPVGDYEDRLEVKLRHPGVAPLIVERFTASDENQQESNIISWMPELPKGIYWRTFTSDIDGLCIPPNQDAVLVQLAGDSDDEDFALFRDEVRRALSRLTVRVEYKDIYGRRMPTKQRDLKHFARLLPEEDTQTSKEDARSLMSDHAQTHAVEAAKRDTPETHT